MPTVGVQLKAGWYEVKEETITLVSNDTSKAIKVDNPSLSENRRFKIDLSTLLPEIPSNGITIEYKICYRWYDNAPNSGSGNGLIALYEGFELNSAYE